MTKTKKNPCGTCNGACCRYVSVHIDTPNSLDDFDEVKWFVSHRNIVVYKDCEDDWLVEFNTRCKFLNKNNRCTDYENRTDVCRDYGPDDCTKTSTADAKIVFRKPSDVERHTARRWPKKKKKRKTSA